MKKNLVRKVVLISHIAIITPAIVYPLLFPASFVSSGGLSFISLRSQVLLEKKTEEETRPVTAQSLIDTLNNQELDYEYRFNAIDLAGQLPKDEYIKFLKDAIKVSDGQIAATATIILFKIDERLLDQNTIKSILSMASYGQGMILRHFVERSSIDPNDQFSELSRNLLQQYITTAVSNNEHLVDNTNSNLSSEMKQEESLLRLENIGLACLLLVTSTPNLSKDDRAILRAVRLKFPKESRVWLAGSLAKDITESDLKIGQPIYKDELAYKPLRIAVALALSPVDTKAERFFVDSVENLLSTAPSREADIEKDFDSTKLLQLVQFNVELRSIGWLRFYNGSNARTLVLKSLNSKSHSVVAYSGLVAAERFPIEMISFLENKNSKSHSLADAEVLNYFSLLAILHPQHTRLIRKTASQESLMKSMDRIKEKGIIAIFKGAGVYLGM